MILPWASPFNHQIIQFDFHPHEVVSCWRDPQLQVSENYSDLTKWRLQGSTLTLARWPEASKNHWGPVNHLRYWPWGQRKNYTPLDIVYTKDQNDKAKGQ